jgi:tRNA nucleotidyltransferase (CCA-adding enzyme)
MAAAPEQGAMVLERLRELPGGSQVLELAAGRNDVELVGGAVRDLLLGAMPREIDLVLDGSPPSFPDAAVLFARDLAPRLACEDGAQPQVSVHERFGTAAVRWSGGRVDIAARRTEIYQQPGALPQVRAGSPEQDLRRRDFTVNAIAVALGGSALGAMRFLDEALADLQGRRLRVLHDTSFQDDPTRLLRLGRYAARLGFAVESHTAVLAGQALAGGVMARVSAARIGAELRLALGEADLLGTLGQLAGLGVLGALDPPMCLERDLLADALRLLPTDGRPDLLALGSLLRPLGAPASDADKHLRAALEGFECPAVERAPVIETALRSDALSRELGLVPGPSGLLDLLGGVPVEAIALAGALAGAGQGRAAAESWLTELRHIRLQISGDDLLAAGVQAGPEVGERLAIALRRRLDGTIEPGRDAEMQAALG